MMKAYPAYKESGVKWLGIIPKRWDIKQYRAFFTQRKAPNTGLQEKNLLSLSYGKIIQKDIHSSGGLTPESFASYNIIQKGDIILRLTDLQNDHKSLRTGLCTQRGIITSAYVSLRPLREDVLSPYFQYQLHVFDSRKCIYGSGGGVRQTLNYDILVRLKACVPPSQEQNAIVTYLDKKCAEIDELVSRRQAIIERLKELKQSIIAEAVTKGLNPDVPMKDSGTAWQSKVPAHWNKLRHKNVLYPKVSYIGDNTEKLPMLSLTKKGVIVRDVSSGKGKFSADESKFLIVEPSDFVFCHYDIQETPRTVGLSNYHGYITGSYNVYGYKGYNHRFFYYLHEYIDDRKLLCPLYKGLRNTIRQDRFLAMRIFLPPENEQKAIVSYLDKKCAEIDTLISRQEQIIEKLKELKTSTIAHVVTGKVDVRDTL